MGNKDAIHVYSGFYEKRDDGLSVSYQRLTKDGFPSSEEAIQAGVALENRRVWVATHNNPGALETGIHKNLRVVRGRIEKVSNSSLRQ